VLRHDNIQLHFAYYKGVDAVEPLGGWVHKSCLSLSLLPLLRYLSRLWHRPVGLLAVVTWYSRQACASDFGFPRPMVLSL